MSQVPYPGKLTPIERQNLDAVQFKPATQTIKFSFTFSMLPKIIITLPVNSLVKGLEPVSVEESFDGTSSTLYLGTPENKFAFGNYSLHNLGVALAIGNIGGLLMVPTTVAFPVIIAIDASGSTKGSGWGLFKWTNLNLVRRV